MSNVIMIDYFNPFEKKKKTDGATPEGENTTESPKQLTYKTEADLEDPEQGREVIISPLAEDVTLQIETSFMKPGSLMPASFTRIMSWMQIGRQGRGATSAGPNMLDIMDVPIWDKTEPVKFDLKLQFFLDTDSYMDVVRPVAGLTSLCMLSPNIIGKASAGGPNGFDQFLLPGLNFRNLSQVMGNLRDRRSGDSDADVAEQGLSFKDASTSKIVAIEIPGIIYISVGMVEKATPVFSKEITETGLPLWGELQLTIISLRSANTDMFVPGVNPITELITESKKKYMDELENDGFFPRAGRSGAI